MDWMLVAARIFFNLVARAVFQKNLSQGIQRQRRRAVGRISEQTLGSCLRSHMSHHDDTAYPTFPSWDMDNGVFRAWWFDPLLATFSFAFFINWYWYEERRRGLASTEIVDHDIGPIFSSLFAYWIGIYILKSVVIAPGGGVLPDGIPQDLEGFLYLSSEVVSGVLLYDAVFFFVHWAMHEIPVLKSWHARHHSHPRPLEARDTLRHSIVDGSLQVLINICVQGYTPWGMVKSRLARAFHNLIVVWMLTESHTASPAPYIWRRWCVGVREHRLHHYGSHGKHHRHQQFFGYLDDARAWFFQNRKRQM